MTSRKLISAHSNGDYAVFKQLLLEYAARDLADPANSIIWDDIAQLPGRYAPPTGGVLLVYAGETATEARKAESTVRLGDNASCNGEVSGGNLAGCGAFVSTRDPGVAEIKRVYVRSSFRRQGLARALTLALVAAARETGYQTAAISTWPHNAEALSLYRHLGFVPCPPFKEHQHSELVFLGLKL